VIGPGVGFEVAAALAVDVEVEVEFAFGVAVWPFLHFPLTPAFPPSATR